jgi:RimJ/RimL family protein N-acetyltransferase
MPDGMTPGTQPASVALPKKLAQIPFALFLEKARRRVWSTRRAVAVVRDFDQGRPLRPGEIEIELVEPEAFAELAALVDESSGKEYLYLRPIERTRLARAGTLSVARDEGGELLAFHFIHGRDDHDALEGVAPGMYPQQLTDEVLTEAVYCVPAHRGHAIAPAMLQATGAALLERGIRRGWAYLDTTNVPALRMFARAGYVPAGTERVDRYRLGRFRTAFGPIGDRTLREWRAVAG